MTDGSTARHPVLLAIESVDARLDVPASASAIAEGVRRAAPWAQVYSLPGSVAGEPAPALDGADLIILGTGVLEDAAALPAALVDVAHRARDAGIGVLAIAGSTPLGEGALAEYGVGVLLSAEVGSGNPADRVAAAVERGVRAHFTRVAAIANSASVKPAKSSPLPVEPTPYFQFFRTPRSRWWKGILVILSFLVGFFLLSLIFGGIAVAIDITTGTRTFDDLLTDPSRITPVLFLCNNLSLAALIPLTMLLQWAFYGQRPRWLSSVAGGLRWRWMLLTLAITVPVFAIFFVIETLIEPFPIGRIGPNAIFLLVAILLTTPLQAAGEEYAARGLLQRAAGSWTRSPLLAFVIGSVIANGLFMLGHAAGDPWLNIFYFSLGVMLSVLAWRTGGLEAGIAVHAVNNLLGLIPVALYGNIDTVFERSNGSGGPIVLLQLVVVFLIVVGVSFMAKRRRLRRMGPPDVLASSNDQHPTADSRATARVGG